jgi:hypothetical protein
VTTRWVTPREGHVLAHAGPFDGIPDHLETPLMHWLHRQLIDPRRSFLPALRLGSEVKTSTLHKVTLAARIALPGHPDPMDDLKHLLRWGRSPDGFLDFLHFMLQVTDVSEDDVRALDRSLERGGSEVVGSIPTFGSVLVCPMSSRLSSAIPRRS